MLSVVNENINDIINKSIAEAAESLVPLRTEKQWLGNLTKRRCKIFDLIELKNHKNRAQKIKSRREEKKVSKNKLNSLNFYAVNVQ